MVFGVCVLEFGCKDQKTIWMAEAWSPDGSSVASASTVQYGGPGNAGLYTYVYIRRTAYSNPRETILAFDDNNATLSDSGTFLAMKWITPSHLEVTYDGHLIAPYFQVVKCLGIDISTRDVATVTTNPSH